MTEGQMTSLLGRKKGFYLLSKTSSDYVYIYADFTLWKYIILCDSCDLKVWKKKRNKWNSVNDNHTVPQVSKVDIQQLLKNMNDNSYAVSYTVNPAECKIHRDTISACTHNRLTLSLSAWRSIQWELFNYF